MWSVASLGVGRLPSKATAHAAAGMTRLDLLLAATIAVVAFALGTSLGPDVATAWKRSIAPSATYELRERVPTYREALATFDSRQAKVRNRIAEEHLAILAATQAPWRRGVNAVARSEPSTTRTRP